MRMLVLLLALSTLDFAVPCIHAQEVDKGVVPSEMWFGVLDAKSRKFRFVLELTQGDGPWTGSLLSLDEGNRRFPLDSLSYRKDSFSFLIKSSAGSFEGTPNDDATTISGLWKQSGAELELAFDKVAELPQEKLKTRWVGQLNVLFQKLDVAFREFENGELLFDSLTQKVGGFVASKTEADGEVQFDVPAIKGSFKGKYSEKGDEIVGHWTQGIVSVELVLKKSDAKEPVVVAPRRPQTPKPPFPYESIDVRISNDKAKGVTLAGTLTIPSGGKPVPVVVLISGSGPQDRDETIFDHKPFWVIADHLSRQGIAVLRFDDRGVADSTGDFAEATSADFAGDVEAIVDFLASHERVDKTKIGLCGHSEGGLIAPMVAAKDKRIAFVVMLAGPGVNGEQILASQSRLILEATGTAQAETERQVKIQRIYLDLAKQLPPLSKNEFIEAASPQVEPLLTEAERSKGDFRQFVGAAAEQLQSPWFRYFLTYEPAPTLQELTCPILALNGGKDLQVAAGLNIDAIKQALTASGHSDFDTVVLPELNHLFQKCATGTIEEYGATEETFNAAALTVLSDWIEKHVAE